MSRITLVLVSLILSISVNADVIFSEDFQDGNFNGWAIGGNGSSAIANYYGGNYSLRLRRTKTATQAISTLDYSNVSVSTSIAAYSLESVEQCIAEISVNGGSSWTAVNTVANGQDDGVTLYSASASPSGIDNNANVSIRLRAKGNRNNDYCYFDNISLEGDYNSQPPSCDYDCLSGDGNVNRNELSYNDLQSTGNGNLLDFSAYALPAEAKNPSNQFEGRLIFTGVQRGWSSVKDPYNYAGITDVKKLPDFDYQLIQLGTHLIPVDRGLQKTNHYLWQLILEPGRVWDENSDNGFSRASIPFALQEYGANCTHNGVLTFLFKSDGLISSVAYQIASETCAYYQFNLHGLLTASYTPETITNGASIQSSYQQEVTNREPTKALSELATDFPASGVNTNNIATEQASANLSAFGIAYQGTHYVGGCDSRAGAFPYCEVLSLPSYSVAKSVDAGYGLMALEQAYPGVKNLKIANYVSACPSSNWNDVTFENALDMATGNYTSVGFEVDEGSAEMLAGFFQDYTDFGKTNFSCSYSRQSTPGTTWVYHTTDSYLLGKAMDQFLGEDHYDWLVETLYQPLGLSPSLIGTVRTFDTAQRAMTGFGMTLHSDDVIKLAQLLNDNDGKIGGQQKLDLTMTNQTLQNTSYHGLSAGSAYDWYDNGFWIWKADEALGCSNDLYIPYMSGYGGISVILLPDNMVYYFFSDNSEYTFVNSVQELDKIADFCH